jgi:glucose/arabinose dehydrogenase
MLKVLSTRRLFRLSLIGLCAVAACGVFAPPPTAAPIQIITAAPPTATTNATATRMPTKAATALAPTQTVAPSPTTPPPTEAPISALNPDAYALSKIADGLAEPVYLTHAGDESGRLFIVEQPGTIRIMRDGALLPEPFLDLSERVDDGGNEQGLLGLAFHPKYSDNGLFFVNYTDNNGDTVVARFRVGADADRADPTSEFIVLKVDQPYGNHNGGDLAFGPDGYLYIGLGDGGSAGDPENRAQNLGELLGKMLRIDVDVPPEAGGSYLLPEDNPFLGQAGVRPEIWAYGLRNPWRYSFDRVTGDLYMGDVGQGDIEEINFQPAGSRGGENYGWRFFEGTRDYQDSAAAPAGVIPPVTEYPHAEGGCSVTGGYVYRGETLPALTGVYLFGDYCSGIIWMLYRDAAGVWQRQTFGQTDFAISSFGEDQAGELYVLNHRAGEVYQLVANGQ